MELEIPIPKLESSAFFAGLLAGSASARYRANTVCLAAALCLVDMGNWCVAIIEPYFQGCSTIVALLYLAIKGTSVSLLQFFGSVVVIVLRGSQLSTSYFCAIGFF